MAVRCNFQWVVVNFLLICLSRFIQFSGYIRIVIRSDRQLFPLAGMFPQLECLGEVLAGSPKSAETEVVPAYRPVAHGKIGIELDRTLMERQGCGGAFLMPILCTKAIRLQSFQRRGSGLCERNIKLLHRSQ